MRESFERFSATFATSRGINVSTWAAHLRLRIAICPVSRLLDLAPPPAEHEPEFNLRG